MILVSVIFASDARVVKLLEPKHNKLVATPEGLELLRSFDGPVSVVTFIGRARSGKSFGLNNLLRVPHDAGFRVGHTFEPETSGALMWSEPFPGSTAAAVLAIDTEGLGTGPQTYDKAMLAVTSAISSRMVYHMMGYVYTEDVLRLHGLACLVEDYEKRGILDSAVLPRITWLLNKNDLQRSWPGQSDKEVLFGVPLAERPNVEGSDQIAQFNATVKVVKGAFEDHVVHLTPSAAPTGVDCASLTNLPYESLSGGYVAVMNKLRDEIASEPPRVVPGSASKAMTGADVAALIEAVLPAANEGIDRVGDRMAQAIVARHVSEAKAAFAAGILALAYPMDEGDLDAAVTRLETRCRRDYRTAPPALADLLVHSEGDLEEKFYGERMRASVLNADASDEACATAAASAAELFSHGRMTNNGTADMDVGAFDAAVGAAVAQYAAHAVGPRARYHEDQLRKKAREAREAAISETAPLRRRMWLGGSALVAVACYTTKVYVRMFESWPPLRVMSAALEGLGNFAVVVATIAVLSMFGCDSLLRFDTVAGFLSWLRDFAFDNSVVMIAVAGCFAVAIFSAKRLNKERANKAE